MQLPDHVRRIADEYAEAAGFAALRQAAAALSDAYREGRGGAPANMAPDLRAAAYVAVRMPATYAAAFQVLGELRERLGTAAVASVLDAGAGTGAASLAARQWFPEAAVTMIERDAALANAARRWLPDAALLAQDLAGSRNFPPHDLVIASYSLGEAGQGLARRLWEAARIALVIIEPGTPRGFALIRDIRADLLARGAFMAAPCPAATACPLAEPDWCHFAARVERSSMHRRIKQAELGYEDEKFSYLALVREAVALPGARVIRRPQQRPGLVLLDTCTPRGVERVSVTRHEPEVWRSARRVSWGDAWK